MAAKSSYNTSNAKNEGPKNQAAKNMFAYLGMHQVNLIPGECLMKYNDDMATSKETISYIEDQCAKAGVTSRKMFGEYALYVGKKVVALVCDDTLFVKITEPGKTFVGKHYKEGFAYPGAKASMRINEDLLEDREWLTELIEITAEALPNPKAKKTTKKRI